MWNLFDQNCRGQAFEEVDERPSRDCSRRRSEMCRVRFLNRAGVAVTYGPSSRSRKMGRSLLAGWPNDRAGNSRRLDRTSVLRAAARLGSRVESRPPLRASPRSPVLAGQLFSTGAGSLRRCKVIVWNRSRSPPTGDGAVAECYRNRSVRGGVENAGMRGIAPFQARAAAPCTRCTTSLVN